MYVVACMSALPLTHFFNSEASGLSWELKSPPLQYAVVFFMGMLAADFWTYLKHRLLHTRPLYAIQKHHHSFPNPSAYAGFAIHPFETLWTFAPIYLWDHLEHWLPVFCSAVGAFF